MQRVPRQIWLLAIGRWLSQLGSGLTLFYAPIFFVQYLHLSATEVGLALGCQSISGVGGRLISGSLVDRVGRKPLLLVAMLASAIAAGGFALAQNFTALVGSNLLFGLGIGLYWPANESLIADLTPEFDLRRSAYGITRLADNLGLGMGIVGGGLTWQWGLDYRWLFWLDGVSFVLFGVLIGVGISESHRPQGAPPPPWQGYRWALADRRLQLYLAINVLFTTYVAQLETAVPLYITRFTGGTTARVTGMLTFNLILMAACQIPVIRWLRRDRHAPALGKSALLWAASFGALALASTNLQFSVAWLGVAMAGMAVAVAIYNPTASALTADMAPPQLMGIYTSLNSLCWAAGFALGPPLGGWALDHSRGVMQGFWWGLALVAGVQWLLLRWLDRQLLAPGTAKIDT